MGEVTRKEERFTSDDAAVGNRETFIDLSFQKRHYLIRSVSIESAVFGGQFVGLDFYTYIYFQFQHKGQWNEMVL